MRGATAQLRRRVALFLISIHTPHAGSDKNISAAVRAHRQFQSTLPMRGATPILLMLYFKKLFQSTLPMRGATIPERMIMWKIQYFNPHSPCGERQR